MSLSWRIGALLVVATAVGHDAAAAAPPPSPPAGSRGVIALGGPSSGDYYPAMDIPPQAQSNVWAVSGGTEHSMAIYGPERRVIEWPRVHESGAPWWPRANGTYRDQPPNLTNVTAISAGYRHSLALRRNGRVVMWTRWLTGDNRTDYLPGFITRANVKAISAAKGGSTLSLFLLKNGSVIEWPPHNYSETFYQDSTPWIAPRPHALLMSGSVRAVAAGYEHCLALLKNGTVVAWGGKRGTTQAGIRAQFRSVQVPAAAQANVTAIAAGMAHSLALLRNGTLVAWGRALPAGLAGGTTCAAEGCGGVPPPPGGPNAVPYAALSGVKAIAAGQNIAVALLSGDRGQATAT